MIKSNAKILFVCIGNTCRSVLAEHIAKEKYRNSGIEFYSAGVEAENKPVQKETVEVIRLKFKKDISFQISKKFSEFSLDEFNYIVVLDKEKYKYLLRTGRGKGKLYCKHVDDPYGNNLASYMQAYDEITEIIDKFISQILTNNKEEN